MRPRATALRRLALAGALLGYFYTAPPLRIAYHGAGEPITFEAIVRIDTPKERDYYEHGGILHYVLRQLARAA